MVLQPKLCHKDLLTLDPKLLSVAPYRLLVFGLQSGNAISNHRGNASKSYEKILPFLQIESCLGLQRISFDSAFQKKNILPRAFL